MSPERVAPLSQAQRHFWLLDRMTGGHPVYTVPRRYRIEGPFEGACLERALGEVARRHEVLRTRLPDRENGPVQEVLPSRPFRLPIVDLSGRDEAGRAEQLAALESEAARRPFDLSGKPAWRATLARLGPEDHVLLLALHHVAFDGWSRPILEEELSVCYRAFASGASPPLDPLPLQYADFAEWEKERLSDERLDPLLDWWRERLADLPVVDLPRDRPRPGAPSFDGACHRFEVPPALGRRVRVLATARRATPFMALLAAFHALLHRITGAVDLPVGCPTAGRVMPDSETLIGCFLNPVVMRGDVSGDPSFEELVDRARRVTLDALTHAEMRFERLVEYLGPTRVPGMNPFFQVLFQLLAFPRSTLSLGEGTDVESRLIDRGGATVDLAWSLVPEGDGFVGQVEYATALFRESTVQGLAGRFVALLERALEQPTVPISQLPLLSPSETQRILIDWNATSTPYPRDRSIVDLFDEQAHRDPDATAIEAGGLTMSYAELARRSDRLAGALIETGVGRDAPVGLCMDRSPEMIVGMLAALRAGGAYVPLDPGYPDERLRFMVEDAGIGAVVVGPGAETRGFGPGVTVLGWDAGSDRAPATAPGAEDLAYVLYTSGSTGTAKGVAVEHRAVVRLVRDTDYVSIGPADRLAHASNPSFDATTFEVWGALLNGASIVILDPDTVLDPPRLARELRERSVSALFLTTALFNAVADELPDAFRTVRTVMFGGEAVDPVRVRTVLAEGPPERLLHVYGPTECTTFATWHRVTEVPVDAETIPIGRPIANTRAWIVDPSGQPVPPGVPGELLLGGDGLARGYHGSPDLTGQRFVHAAFGTGERVYRTGDRVRRDDEGAIVFLGRLDRQVKVRGFRIEPGEIEAALGRHPSVRECVVAPREAKPGDRRLVAWIVPDGDAPPTAEWSAWLSDRLPRYMLPSAYVVVDAMPLTRNGKVDVNALPDPSPAGAAEGPRTRTERMLAAVWREVLGVPEVGRTDDFYDLGGHSLLAVHLFSAIEERTGRRLSVSFFDQGLTIAAVAEWLERETPVPGTRHLVPIRSHGSRPPLFLVHGGQGHVFVYSWLVRQLDGDRPAFGFHLKGVRCGDFPRTVEEMAERYLKDLEVAWPEGPCLLGGYSFGGVVAWEMARRLRARGRAVPLLVLIEATDDLLQAHSAPVRAWRKARRLGGETLRTLAQLLRKPPSDWPEILSHRAARARAAILDRPPDLPQERVDRPEAMMAATRWAVRHYRPGRYAGRTLYLRAAAQVGRRLIWRSFADDLELVVVPGDGHASFLKRENAQVVAEALKSRLSDAS